MTTRTHGVVQTIDVGPARNAGGRPRRILAVYAGVALVYWGGACSPTGPGSETLPPDVQDPSAVKTATGALGFYHTVVKNSAKALESVVITSGVMTDELADLPVPNATSSAYSALDSRQRGEADDLTANLGTPYASLHKLRGQAQEARGFVATYLPDSSSSLRGHLYALEGYADVFLADLMCSGIPLSTIDFGGDYTIAGGSTTAEVYEVAAALFDSALALAGDSARLQYLAAVGRGRSLLALGEYADAAVAVATVPTDFRYEAVTSGDAVLNDFLSNFRLGQEVPVFSIGQPSMGDREGRNGLDYVSSNDPRTPVFVPDERDALGNAMAYPAKYPQSGTTAFVIASGVEARLIEAEAALAAGGDWLGILNALRTDGTFDTQPNATDPAKTDTLWHAGSGGVAGLRLLADPGDKDRRVDLVFRERAFWLYLTGHRQGDLRRLIRRPEYNRSPDDVYPTGPYPGADGSYGTSVVLLVPAFEAEYNPKYAGCINENA